MTYLTDWSPRDKGLAEGILYLEDATPAHGIPSWIAMDDERSTWLEAQTKVDHAQGVLERWREENKKAEPGAFPVIVDTSPRTDRLHDQAGQPEQ